MRKGVNVVANVVPPHFPPQKIKILYIYIKKYNKIEYYLH